MIRANAAMPIAVRLNEIILSFWPITVSFCETILSPRFVSCGSGAFPKFCVCPNTKAHAAIADKIA